MGDSPQVPSPTPAPIVAAAQQGYNDKAGLDSQHGSMVGQDNPYGSLKYSQSGTSSDGTPLYTATTTLTPENQQLLDTLQGTKKTAGTAASNLISGANYGAAQPKDVIGDMQSGWMKDAMGKEIAYLKPQQDYDVDRLDNQLKNQGFKPGDVAYDKAMNALKQSHGQTITGFEATMSPTLLQQAQQMYMLPAQLGGSLANFGAPTDPSWVQTPNLNIQPANYIGAQANYDAANQKAYEAQMTQNNAKLSGMFGIPSAILGGWAQNGGLSALMGAGAMV